MSNRTQLRRVLPRDDFTYAAFISTDAGSASARQSGPWITSSRSRLPRDEPPSER